MVAIGIYGGSYVTIDSLELTDSHNGPAPTYCVGENGPRGGAIKFNRRPGTEPARDRPHPHHFILSNLNAHGFDHSVIQGSGDYSQLLNSHIHDNGGRSRGWSGPLPEAYGTYLKGRNWLIRGNRIHGHSGNGIRTGNPPNELIVDSIIENNIIYNNGGSWLHPNGSYGAPDFFCEVVAAGGDGIVVWHGSGNIIRNNISFNNVGRGIRVNENFDLSNTPNVVYNNTVYRNGKEGIYCYENNRTIVKNNISYLSGQSNIFSGCTNQLSNNLTTDPKFVNAASGDFGLQADSPAINGGFALTAEVPVDFIGTQRPIGAAHDIGAFEGAGSRPNPIPPPAGGGGGGGTGGGIGSCYK